MVNDGSNSKPFFVLNMESKPKNEIIPFSVKVAKSVNGFYMFLANHRFLVSILFVIIWFYIAFSIGQEFGTNAEFY